MPRVLIFLSSVILLAVVSCSDASGRRAEQGLLDREMAALPVEAIEVKQQDVVEWIRGVGTVSANQSVNIGAEVGGKVAEIRVDVGDLVREGDVLARLDDERLRIARNLARAEVNIAAANLEDAKSDVRRQEDLFNDGIISETVIEDAKLEVSTNKGKLEMAKAKLAAAERNLADATVVSPIDGEITRRHVDMGELIQPGDLLFDIVDIREVKVLMYVSEQDVTRLRQGQQAVLEVDGYPGLKFHGKLHTISAEADSETRTFPVEILVRNDGRPEKLLPGFIGRVGIRGRVFENAILIPEEVVVIRDGNPTVYVVASDTTSARIVEPGFKEHGYVLIRDGLEAGDRVIVTGQESLQDGARILVR